MVGANLDPFSVALILSSKYVINTSSTIGKALNSSMYADKDADVKEEVVAARYARKAPSSLNSKCLVPSFTETMGIAAEPLIKIHDSAMRSFCLRMAAVVAVVVLVPLEFAQIVLRTFGYDYSSIEQCS
jgi:hypothetical protein